MGLFPGNWLAAGKADLTSEERSTWRSGVRSAMCATSQLPGKGPTDVDDAPAQFIKILWGKYPIELKVYLDLCLHVNQKSDYDDDEIRVLSTWWHRDIEHLRWLEQGTGKRTTTMQSVNACYCVMKSQVSSHFKCKLVSPYKCQMVSH